MKKEEDKPILPEMDMNQNPIWDVLDGKISPRKKDKKKKLKKKRLPGIDENIERYFHELETEKQVEVEKSSKQNKKKLLSIYYVIILLILGIVVSFTIMIVWKYDQIKVESNAMSNQIKTGDRILYQPDLKVNRFNVVVLEKDNQKELLRVIGMPGDKVTLSEDVLTINNAIYDEDYLKENYVDFKLQEKNREQYYTADFTVAELKDINNDTLLVPENKYILLGDNRIDAKDSREIGFYDKSDIQGVAMMKVWPLVEIEPIK